MEVPGTGSDRHLRELYIQELVKYLSTSYQTLPKGVVSSHQEEHTDVIVLLENLADIAMKHFEERLQSYFEDLTEADLSDCESARICINKYIYMENFLMQTYRNKKAEETDVSQGSQGASSGNRYSLYHQDVLTKCHSDFIEDVNLDGTYIMDELVNDQLMTNCERESIIQENTPRRRKEAFLSLMKGRLCHDTLINKFIPAIQQDHPIVAAKLKETALELAQSPPMFTVCAVCNMKQTVQVKYIAEHLHTHGIIPTDLYEEFRSIRSTNASKWTTLTARVPNPNHITEAVKCKFPVVYDHLKRENSTDLSCKCLERRVHALACARDDSIDTEATVDVANVADLESMLGTSVSASATSPESLEEYTMRSSVKGHAILINNKASNPSKDIQEFYDLDTRKLDVLLTQNGFQTKILTNLTAKEMKLMLQRIANLNHSAYDAFVCVIHCEMDTRDKKVFLLDAKCKPLMFEEIKDMFSASRCPTLAGKPKIFFLPSGVRRNHMNEHSNVPNEADFLIVRATAPGYSVWGDHLYKGSLWVSVFHQMFQRYSESLDFLNLLTLVAAHVGYVSLGMDKDYKQSPHVESTLRKMLIFRSPTDTPDHQDQTIVKQP